MVWGGGKGFELPGGGGAARCTLHFVAQGLDQTRGWWGEGVVGVSGWKGACLGGGTCQVSTAGFVVKGLGQTHGW